MRSLTKGLALFLIGGIIYLLIELLFRGRSHWTMLFVGGICFLICGEENENLEWDAPLWMQMMMCAFWITIVEFIAGCILNIFLGLNIWDYSGMLLNFAGQICLSYSALWFFLSGVAIVLDDYIRYWFFDGEKPHYTWRI